ncbi:hypothetical protein CSUI_010469, partial [Cystoisospora suis]
RFGIHLLFLLLSINPQYSDFFSSQESFPSFSSKKSSLLYSLGLLERTSALSPCGRAANNACPASSLSRRSLHAHAAEKRHCLSFSVRDKKEEKERRRKSVFCFTERILEHTFVLRDSLMHAASSASQQIHVGFHLNFVLPLLAIYARLLSLLSPLSSGGEQELKRYPDLIQFFTVSHPTFTQRLSSGVQLHQPFYSSSLLNSKARLNVVEGQKDSAAAGVEEERSEGEKEGEFPRKHVEEDVKEREGVEENGREEKNVEASSQSVSVHDGSTLEAVVAAVGSAQKIPSCLEKEGLVCEEERDTDTVTVIEKKTEAPCVIDVDSFLEEQEEEDEGEVVEIEEQGFLCEGGETRQIGGDGNKSMNVDLPLECRPEGGEGEEQEMDPDGKELTRQRVPLTETKSTVSNLRRSCADSSQQSPGVRETVAKEKLSSDRSANNREERRGEGGKRRQDTGQAGEGERKAKMRKCSQRRNEDVSMISAPKDNSSRDTTSSSLARNNRSTSDVSSSGGSAYASLAPVIKASLPSSQELKEKDHATNRSLAVRSAIGGHGVEVLRRGKNREVPVPLQREPPSDSSSSATPPVSCSSVSTKKRKVSSMKKSQEAQVRRWSEERNRNSASQCDPNEVWTDRKGKTRQDGQEEPVQEKKDKERIRGRSAKSFSQAYRWYVRCRYLSFFLSSSYRKHHRRKDSDTKRK